MTLSSGVFTLGYMGLVATTGALHTEQVGTLMPALGYGTAEMALVLLGLLLSYLGWRVDDLLNSPSAR